MDTTGNTVLITGAGTGIGLEAAKRFDERGNRVVMVARNGERLEREAARLKDAHPFACDISDAEQVGRLVDYVRSEHPADLLAMCATYSRSNADRKMPAESVLRDPRTA